MSEDPLPTMVSFNHGVDIEENMQIGVMDIAGLGLITSNDAVMRLFDYWTEKCGSQSLPLRSDLNLLDFGFAIGRISLVDVLESPRRFRYRLVSTSITNRLGYEMTHKYVDDIPDEEVRAYVENLYTRTIELRVPLYEKSSRVFDNKKWRHEALVLPISSGSEIIDMLMVYRTVYNPEPLPRWGSTEDGRLP